MGILVQLPTRRRDEQKTKGTKARMPNENTGVTESAAEGDGRAQAAVLLFTGVRYERQKSGNSSPFSKIIANSNFKTI